MHKHWAHTCFAALTLTAICTLPLTAQAQQRVIERSETRMTQRNVTPTPGARIEPRIRSGMAERAPPLTVTRNARPTDSGRTWAYTGRTYGRGSYYNERRSGWFPGLIAAPFLLPWYLLGGGYDAGYGPYYEDPWYDDPYAYPAYPGPSTTFSAPLGQYCATPQKTCLLYTPAEVGLGCSCRAPAGFGRFRGTVVP